MDILPNPDSATVGVPSQLGVTSGPRAAVARLPRFDEALNTIDAGITQTLIQRDAVSLRIGAYKKAHGNAIFDPEREEIVRNDMFEFLKIKAHAVGNVGRANNQSDNFWNAIMAYSRSIQESAETSGTIDAIESLRTEMDNLNRKIVKLVAERMKLFARQPQIEGHGILPIHTKPIADNYRAIFTELDGLCMAGRGARLPVGDGGWSSD